ncbi:hypothetical protein ERJ75_000996800 [Trypanosoma vivax]|uniref:Uncharacterized protein n=1 Tax=Trypanosoma vivax (strain Y486) TaxID=1055687 RepID=G0UAT2_TRYVY|nr:hypothetical protein TRVL_02145 [Trypanosoma vivax]KAH8611526.1 hypothetical protein ERJ75_000996800 [Trypanosoma vivax]CCC52919.1 conserved hypothetical protein [Trypanosoma vivax Y486]
MRYRFGNGDESRAAKSRRLFGCNDSEPLSNEEQALVIEFLTESMHSCVRSTRILAALQLLISFLYAGMLLLGYPLVLVVFDAHDHDSLLLPVESASANVMSSGGSVAIAFAALLWAVGGLGDLRLCRRELQVSKKLLTGNSAGGGVYSAPVQNRQNCPSSASSPACAGTDGASCCFNLAPHQFVIAALVIAPTIFWLYVMHKYRVHLKESKVIMLGISDVWVELLLVLWQPLAHIALGKVHASTIRNKEELVRLARLKYDYEKL